MTENNRAEQTYSENVTDESQRAAVEARRQEALARKAEFFGKWMWIYFLMIILETIVAVISLDIVGETCSVMQWIGPLLGLACSVASGVVLLKMSEREYQYKIAGVLYITGNIIEAAVELSGIADNWALFILLPTAVFGLIAMYNEWMGHASVMIEIDNVLAEKWRKLWKRLLIGIGGMFGSIMLMLMIPVVGLVAFLVSAIAVAVIAIMKMVCLYQSAKACSRWFEDTSTGTETMV